MSATSRFQKFGMVRVAVTYVVFYESILLDILEVLFSRPSSRSAGVAGWAATPRRKKSLLGFRTQSEDNWVVSIRTTDAGYRLLAPRKSSVEAQRGNEWKY